MDVSVVDISEACPVIGVTVVYIPEAYPVNGVSVGDILEAYTETGVSRATHFSQSLCLVSECVQYVRKCLQLAYMMK